MPDYSQLSFGRSSDGSDTGDEEKLLANFDSSQQNSSTNNTFQHCRNWLAERSNSTIIRKKARYAPAQEAISLEAKILSVKINQTSNIFNAEPSPEMPISESQMKKLNDSEGHLLHRVTGRETTLARLMSINQLHFLKYLCQYIHQDYYTIIDINVPVKDHVNHCIEMLRQVIMYKADTALMTYEWLPDFPGPWPNFGIQHECVNWEKIDNWSKKRSIDIFEPKYLHHPKLGFSHVNHGD
ncbi:hypothetical protein IFR04_004176 [Cadophora malorum]|uniref:Uncharacterized protein n=1 Tax=Cadophora malorum TaxID=108018 RepID=A0A8H7WD71_9HELO|nr:hypothetical protein IFR04_004176 [Cadophora malorum]